MNEEKPLLPLFPPVQIPSFPLAFLRLRIIIDFGLHRDEDPPIV
jgi:hypothetical protein